MESHSACERTLCRLHKSQRIKSTKAALRLRPALLAEALGCAVLVYIRHKSLNVWSILIFSPSRLVIFGKQTHSNVTRVGGCRCIGHRGLRLSCCTDSSTQPEAFSPSICSFKIHINTPGMAAVVGQHSFSRLEFLLYKHFSEAELFWSQMVCLALSVHSYEKTMVWGLCVQQT